VYSHYQTELVCALCAKTIDDVGYRMHINVAICNHCVDKLIEKALSNICIVTIPPAPGPKGVQ
jgi:recombinational DNA repair protein (RecF pathway)